MEKIALPNNFLGIEPEFSEYAGAAVALHSIPFDKACSWTRGASNGPAAVIAASQQLELYDIETESEPYRCGVWTAPPTVAETSEQMVAAGFEAVNASLEDDKFICTLGGDHSISLGPIKAHHQKYPDMCILHLDAHTDRRQSYEGTIYSHASIMARVAEFVPKIISVGIRSMDSSELKNLPQSDVFYAHTLQNAATWIPQVLGRLSPQVYLSLDVDVFDPSLVPSTGTPEPGGLGWYDVLTLLKSVSQQRTLVGLDIVELAPVAENRAPDFLVAKLIYKVLAYKGFAK